MKRLLLFLLLISLTAVLSARDRLLYSVSSAILPGSGELQMGQTQRGVALLASDIVLWSFFIQTAGDIKELQRTYKQYAYQYAGVPLDRDNSYYQVIQNYVSSDDFNQLQELLARNYFILILNDPQAFQDYMNNNTYTGEFVWQWENTQNWHHYRTIRRKHKITKMDNQIFLGLLILNRLVSVIDVNLTLNRRKVQGSLYFSAPASDRLMLNYRIEY
ncbi:MAG: hypothetical protein FJ042_07165 [Candidatus Cloacimonetes bacterium]|nr:hypothetical protein [Candidatus Cloacimonadota bacterium]